MNVGVAWSVSTLAIVSGVHVTSVMQRIDEPEECLQVGLTIDRYIRQCVVIL